jgi:hypothetical protein
MNRFQPHFSAAQIEHMTETANAISEGFANESDREKVLAWCDSARHELVECTSPVTDLANLRTELDMIDRCLGIIENRRSEIQSAMIPADQEFRR